MDILRKENIMQNNMDTEFKRSETVMELRKKIYLLESHNLHKKVPLSDTEMVEKVMKTIKQFVSQEEVK